MRKHGIDKDTLVLFTNDNGGAGKTSSGPLRGGKFDPKYGGAHAGLNPRLVARQNSRRISFLGDHGHHRPAADLDEKNNLADKYPGRVKAMKAVLDPHVAKLKQNTRPAAFVENPKPLRTDAKGIPTLLELRSRQKRP